MSSNSTITLPAASWEAVKILLNQPSWANTPKDIFLAGGLIESGKLELPAKPAPDPKDPAGSSKREDAWNRKAHKKELMGKEIDVIAKCLKHAVQQANLGAGYASAALMEAFLKDDL